MYLGYAITQLYIDYYRWDYTGNTSYPDEQNSNVYPNPCECWLWGCGGDGCEKTRRRRARNGCRRAPALRWWGATHRRARQRGVRGHTHRAAHLFALALTTNLPTRLLRPYRS